MPALCVATFAGEVAATGAITYAGGRCRHRSNIWWWLCSGRGASVLTLVSLLFILVQLTDRDTVSLMEFAILTSNRRDYHGWEALCEPVAPSTFHLTQPQPTHMLSVLTQPPHPTHHTDYSTRADNA